MSSHNAANATATQETGLRPHLRLETRRDAQGACVCLFGDIDVATAGSVRRAIDECVAAGAERVVLDLRHVTFLDCAGVRLIFAADAAARAAGWELLLIEGPVAVQRVFEILGVRQALPFVDTPRSLRANRQRVLAPQHTGGGWA